LAELLDALVADGDFDTASRSQMFGELFRQVNRPMLSTGATERNHQILEPAVLVIGDAGIHEGHDMTEVLMDGFVLKQVFDYRCIFPGELLESLFPAWVRETANIEDESAAVARLVLGWPLMK
jgi:hypothetical protein